MLKLKETRDLITRGNALIGSQLNKSAINEIIAVLRSI